MEAQIILHLFSLPTCICIIPKCLDPQRTIFQRSISGQLTCHPMGYSKLETAVVGVWHQGTGKNRAVEIVKENSKTVQEIMHMHLQSM